jgi:hypothetical protein
MEKRLTDFVFPVGGLISVNKRCREESDLDMERAQDYEMGKREFILRGCGRLGYFNLVCCTNVGYAYLFGSVLEKLL